MWGFLSEPYFAILFPHLLEMNFNELSLNVFFMPKKHLACFSKNKIKKEQETPS